MHKKPHIAAVIDIGSSELRLHIAQATFASGEKEQETVEYLENLSYPLSLGRDTFHAGKLSFDKVDKACEIIKNFIHVARGYGVRNVTTVASTAIREAANADYVTDQIKIKTGIEVRVIDDLEEKRHIYKLLTHYAEESLKKSAIIVYIGTGSMGVNLFVDGKILRTWNIRVGSLRMGELFGQLQEFTRDFYRLVEEYLADFTYKLRHELPEGIKHFIVSGQEIDLIAKLAMAEVPCLSQPLFEIPRQDFETLYDTIKRKTTDRISADFGLDADKADTLLPAACIYQGLLGCTDAKMITVSRMLPCDGLLFELLFPKRVSVIDKRFDKGTTYSAMELARRHGANMAHVDIVLGFSLMIYDKIKKLHGLGRRDKLLLTVASILHDIGECINTLDHHKISYEIVRHADIVGLTQSEQEIVALICRYHTMAAPDLKEVCYQVINTETKVRVSKLAAMLRLADSLDRSHTQKYSRIDVKLCDTALTVTIHTDANVSLEQWSFAEKGRFFAEVFGIKAELRVKKL